MPRKKSVRKAVDRFTAELTQIELFLQATASLTGEQRSWAVELGLVRVYRAFEGLMLEALVGAINNDSSVIAARTGISFPKHLRDEVCEYLVVGDGFFDFRGRDGLIRTVKRFVPESHYILSVIKDQRYRAHLERLSALRNCAVHESAYAKARAKEAVGAERFRGAGGWFKAGARFQELLTALRALASALAQSAPY